MTSQTARRGSPQHPFGTLTTIGWTGEHPEDKRDMAFLLVYSLGDGPDGPETGEAVLRRMAEDAGLPLGESVNGVAAQHQPPDTLLVPGRQAVVTMPNQAKGVPVNHQLPVTLLVEGGQAVVTTPHFVAKYPPTPEWLAAAQERGIVHFMLATRPWPQAVPGQSVGEDALRDFVDEDMIASSAHCVLPVRRIKK